MVVDLNAIPKPGEYLVTSTSELAKIPAAAPIGSLAIIVTNDGVTLKVKRAEGSAPSNWKEL